MPANPQQSPRQVRLIDERDDYTSTAETDPEHVPLTIGMEIFICEWTRQSGRFSRARLRERHSYRFWAERPLGAAADAAASDPSKATMIIS